MGVEDIGTWQSIFELVIAAAVVTNSALIVFTMQLLTQYSITMQFWIFVGFQWVLFSTQYVFSLIVPDIPAEVELQHDRQEFIGRKLLEKEPDEGELEDVDATVTNRNSYVLSANILSTFPASLAGDY